MKKENIKRLAALLLAGMMTMSLAACGASDDDDDDEAKTTSTTAAKEQTDAAEETTDTAENDIPKLTALTQDMTPQPETETAPAVDFELPEVPAEVTEKLAEFREEGMTNSMNFGTAAPVPYRDHTLGDTYLGVTVFGTLDYYLPEDAAGDVAAYEDVVRSEAYTALSTALSNLSAAGVGYDDLSAYMNDIANAVMIDLQANGRYVEMVKIGGISLDEDSQQLYDDIKKAFELSDPDAQQSIIEEQIVP